MATVGKRAKITVDLGDPALVEAVRHVAIEQDRSLRAIVVEALRNWLEEQEDREDIAVIRARRGGATVPWGQVKAEIRDLV